MQVVHPKRKEENGDFEGREVRTCATRYTSKESTSVCTVPSGVAGSLRDGVERIIRVIDEKYRDSS